MAFNIDDNLTNADWPKKTPDTIAEIEARDNATKAKKLSPKRVKPPKEKKEKQPKDEGPPLLF